jgi:hypothetical protein
MPIVSALKQVFRLSEPRNERLLSAKKHRENADALLEDIYAHLDSEDKWFVDESLNGQMRCQCRDNEATGDK